MNFSTIVRALMWLIKDTFRQSLASRLFWIMAAISTIGILLCLSVSVPDLRPLRDLQADPIGGLGVGEKDLADEIARGERTPPKMGIGFGLFQVEYFRDGPAQLHFLMVVLAVGLAGTVGTLLTVIFTGGFLPESLQPQAVSVLLAKPTPRWLILVGKVLGVLAFVAFHAGVFVLGTWLALGIKTGAWMPGYLWSFPLLLGHFAAIFGFSAVLAVLTRNPIACVFGTIVFWGVCFGMNSARHASAALPTIASTGPQGREVASQGRATRGLLEVGYWILPKPADFAILLDRAVSGSEHLALPESFQAVDRAGRFFPVASVLSSLAFAAVMLALAGFEFARMDY